MASQPNSNDRAAGSHLLKSDLRPQMAKAALPDVRKADLALWKVQIGKAIRHTRGSLTLKEFACAIDRDERQVARWEDGTDRPQLDAIFAVPAFRGPLIVALADLAETVEVITEIRVRRRIA